MTFCLLLYINIREHRRGNQKWTVQRNWQHMVYILYVFVYFYVMTIRLLFVYHILL